MTFLLTEETFNISLVNLVPFVLGDVCEDPMANLMKLRQIGSIIEYHEEFDSIVPRVDLFYEHQLS